MVSARISFLCHSHRRRRSGYRRRAALRCAARSRHGDGGGDFSDASRRRDRRFRTKSHRNDRRPGASHPHTDAVRVTGLRPKVRASTRCRASPMSMHCSSSAHSARSSRRRCSRAGRNLHWTSTRLGAVAAIELAGLAVGSLSGLYWQTALALAPVALPSYFGGDRRQCRMRDREGFRRCVSIARPGRHVRRTSDGPVFSGIGQFEIAGTHHSRHHVHSDRRRGGLHVLHRFGV